MRRISSLEFESVLFVNWIFYILIIEKKFLGIVTWTTRTSRIKLWISKLSFHFCLYFFLPTLNNCTPITANINCRRHVTSTIFPIVFTATMTHCTTCYKNNKIHLWTITEEKKHKISSRKIIFLVQSLDLWITFLISDSVTLW